MLKMERCTSCLVPESHNTFETFCICYIYKSVSKRCLQVRDSFQIRKCERMNEDIASATSLYTHRYKVLLAPLPHFLFFHEGRSGSWTSSCQTTVWVERSREYDPWESNFMNIVLMKCQRLQHSEEDISSALYY